ncbi:MAG: hypothetical protein JNK82_42685 [Myxococcaceae bacterium]|nr:hypothetical protein [Myxococcaceae bacterium]
MRTSSFVRSLFLVALAACPHGGTPEDAGSAGYHCTVDEAALEQPTACVWDDACPCGSHCSAGTCTFDCRTDADCTSGMRCDGFGRCVAPEAVGAVTQALKTEKSGTLALEGAPVTLDQVHPQGQVTLFAKGGALAGLRLVAPAGVELRCGVTAAFAGECTLDLAANERRDVLVRVTSPAAAATFEVKVFGRNETLGFRVAYAPSRASTSKPLEGVYRGFAHPVGFGSIARTTTSRPPAPLADVSIPVEVSVFPEAGGRRIVTLKDQLGVVFPEAPTVGELLRASGGELQLRHARRPYAGKGVDPAATTDVGVSAESVSVEKGQSGLAITLKSRFAGVLDPANDLSVTWRLSLGRVGDLPAGATAPALPAVYATHDASARAAVALPAEGAVEAAVGAAFAAATPRTDASLTQTLMCTGYGAMAAVQLAPAVGSPFSGDLACAGNAQPLTFGILRDSTWQLAGTLAKCLADLRQSAAVSAGTMSPSAGMGCLDGPRTLAALRFALDVDRRRALGENVPADPMASALAHRLLQQWVRTHLFVAKQATQVDLLNDILAGENQINRGFMQGEMLELTGRGFDALLEPRLALGISRMTPQVVFEPDYRPRVAPGLALTPNPRHEQTVGLPVTLVDSLQQALNVYGALYERARYVTADRPALEASAKGFLRKSLVLFALASTVNDVTRANNPAAPSWDVLWSRASGQYGIELSGLMRAIDNLARGENPLGLDESLDLPLYRVGDQQGSIARFSAVSDYLLGTGTALDDSSIVPAKILGAEAALADARTAYTQNLQQDFVQAGEDAAMSSRLEAIRRRYGEQVASLCGDQNMSSVNVLDGSQNIDPDTCFIKPSCLKAPVELRARLAPGDVASVLCRVDGVRALLGFAVSERIALAPAPALMAPLLDGRVTVKGHSEAAGVVTVSLSDGSTLSVPAGLFDAEATEPPAGAVSPEQLQQLGERCRVLEGASEAARPDAVPASCALNGDCPGGYACVTGACSPAADTANQTACYTGALGVLAVSIRAAVKDVEVARAELDELSEAYDIQMRKCFITKLGAQAALEATQRHNSTMTTLGAVKLAADIVSNTAGAVADCADAVGGDTKFGAAAAVSCTSTAVASAADSVSDGMDFAMEEAERNHELNLMRIEAQTEERACFTEAEMALVGTRTAVLRIQRANQEVARQLVELTNARNDLAGALEEGREAVQMEMERTVPALSLEFWLNEKVERYGSAFRAARRAAYLGVLAVEYEYQVSTIEKQNVLAATKVSELRGVLERLRNLAATGTVKGRSPGELHSVVSLRTNLLQLADQSKLPPGWHTLTEAQRFQLVLTSPRFAVFGEDGTYLGQEVPFRVAPLVALALGSPGGVALLSGSDCAERVWSVNAALQGDGVIVGDGTRARITLKKRNRFFSQWCAPAPAGAAPFQLSATRPSRNLFLDPFTDYLPGRPGSAPNAAATVDASAEADAFSSARLQPQVNVTRAELETDAYFNGSSRELAGRGLYGDYALFFPAEVLSKGGGEGLRLERLDDVLLRFDYVSVAQN